MAPSSGQNLATLTLVAVRSRIGADFVRPNDAGPEVTLRLVSADPMKRDPRAQGAADRPFNVVFRGPAQSQLTQGMHDLEHPEFILRGIFLVPVGQDGDGCLYEAVFS